MKKLLFIFLIVHCTLNIDNCFSQWVQVNNGMGYRAVYALAAGGNNIFAGTAGNPSGSGVYKSTDNGASWTQSYIFPLSPFCWSLAVNGNYVFAGTHLSGALASTNNGTDWYASLILNQSVLSLATNGTNIYAGTGNNSGVYKSTDNGNTWSQTSLNNRSVYSLAVIGSNVFAGTGSGVYLSTYNGTNWTQTSLNNREVDALAVSGNNIFAGTYAAGVYLSTNNGTNWTQTSLNNQDVHSLAVNGNNIFAGTYPGSFYVSNNNGTNWTQRNEGLGNGTVFALCILNNYIFAGTYVNSVYRRAISELIGIKPISNEVPNQFSLSQNYPNPFNPKTVISFQLAVNSFASLKVYDLLGREVATLVNEQLKPGTYEVDFDGSGFASGVYFYKLTADPETIPYQSTAQGSGFVETRKMVLVK